MADKPKSFSDYYGTPSTPVAATPPSTLPKISSFGSGAAASGAPQDALTWLTDILSRPLFAVTESADTLLEGGADARLAGEKFASGDVLGGLGQVAQNTVKQLSAPLRGFFSTNKDDKHYTSDLIEKGTDIIAPSFDENYVDREDNVNPIIKGVAGFVGDIALDPLTWIPGTALASVGKTVIKGGRATVAGMKALPDAVSQGARAARVADSEVASASSELSKIAKPTKASATAAGAERTARNADESFMADYARQLDGMDNSTFEAHIAQRTAAVAAKDIARQAATPKAGRVKSALDGLTPMTLKTAVRAIADPSAAKPLTFGANPELASGVAGARGWMDEAAEAVQSFEKLSESPHIKVGEKRIPLAAILQKAVQGNSDALKVLEVYYTRNYLPAFAHAKSQGKLIDAIGREVKPKAPKAEAMETILTSLGNFKRQVVESEDLLTQQLGKPLMQSLKAMTNPERFDKVVSEMRGVLDQSIDVSAMTSMSTPVSRMLRQIGVEVDAIPLGVRTTQATPNTAPPASSIEELTARMGGSESDEIVALAEMGIRRAIDSNIVTPKAPERYPFETRTGVLRTDELYGDGWGRYMREANTYYQWNMIKGMFERAGKMAVQEGASYGRARAVAVRAHVKQALRLAERWHDENGIPLTIGVGPDRVPIGLSQVLDVLDDIDPRGMDAYFWNAGTAVPPTNLLDAVFAAIRGGDREQITAMLRQTETRHMSSEGRPKPLPNNLVKPVQNKSGGTLGREKLSGDDLVEGLTNLIEKVTPVFHRVVEGNAKAYGARRIAETYEMVDDQLRFLEDVFANRQGYGEILEALSDTSTRVQKLSEAKGTLQTSTNMTGATVEALIPPADKLIATASVKAVKKAAAVEKASKAKTGAAVMDEVQRAGIEDAQKLFDDLNAGTFDESLDATLDLGEKVQSMLGTGILSKLAPIVSRKASIDQAHLHSSLVRSENIFRDMVSRTSTKLSQISARYPQEQLVTAFHSIQRGYTSPDPAVAQAANEMRDIVGQLLGNPTSRTSLLDNSFFRNNASIHHVNSVMEFYFKGDSFIFDADLAMQAATKNGTTVMQEAALQAWQWDVKDPADFLNKAYTALAKINADQSIAQSFMKMATDLGAVSRVPKAGYSRIVNDTGASILSRYLPADRYYDNDILERLRVVDTIMKDSLKLDGDLGKFINNVYRPVQDAWKYGMTLINPTHHVRNGISDASLTFLADGFIPKNIYNKALHAMGARNGYSNWDAIKAIQGINEVPDAGKVITSGRLGEVTADGYYSAAASRGNLPHFRTLENLEDADEGAGALASVWRKTTQSKPAQVIGGVSEARDHYFRLAHFIKIVEQNIDGTKFKSLDELFDYASDRVRKWHPDGSDLTKSEQLFRLAIPFYSWQRKAIPLIIESVLTQPGRVMAFPKASFNLAVSMGVNPDSLSDPFPQDQMFPSYLTTKITGPQFEIDGKYYGINPGIASNDVLNEYLGDEGWRSVLGSISPIIRAPFELAAGGQVGTGARINDTSDYIDSQIPVVGQLSRMTGNSVTGSLVSILQGRGLDPQFQIAQGNKDPVGGPAVSALNWLTGIGVAPMSQPNQINYAEIEKRNREGSGNGF